MPPSPVVQATQEAIGSLHGAVVLWGRLFEGEGTQRGQLEGQAEAVTAAFVAFSVAYGALPRFRTEPAVRRFMEALQELERAIREVRAPAASSAIAEVAAAVAEGAHQAESAFSLLGGKPVEVRDVGRPVQGTVSRILGDRGYGFVKPSGTTTDVFFTSQGLRGARFSELRVGQNVSFRVEPDPRVPGRMHAIEVQLLR
ncbi:MAG TPA: cold shock domain-containing protein [Dehalococcoidia bacterium]|nr:cold shock domain-containing protein [Dehalococcoidia bacterium]